MRAVLTLARREFTSYFTTPFGWAMLAMIQFILAYQFIGRVALYAFELEGKLQGLTAPPGVTDLVSLHLLSWSAPLFLLVVPLATMRTFSEERRQQTLPLLLSAPLHRTSLVIGKYLGAMAFLILPLLLLGAMTLAELSPGFWGSFF
jgi:ABC-2 type transport system permease protein